MTLWILTTFALAGDPAITASLSVDALKSADGYVQVGSIDNSQAKLECKLATNTLGCRTATKSGAQRVQVTSVDAKAGQFTVVVDGAKVNVDIQGDLVGIRPDPWAE